MFLSYSNCFATRKLAFWPKNQYFDHNINILTTISIFWPQYQYFDHNINILTTISIFWPLYRSHTKEPDVNGGKSQKLFTWSWLPAFWSQLFLWAWYWINQVQIPVACILKTDRIMKNYRENLPEHRSHWTLVWKPPAIFEHPEWLCIFFSYLADLNLAIVVIIVRLQMRNDKTDI